MMAQAKLIALQSKTYSHREHRLAQLPLTISLILIQPLNEYQDAMGEQVLS
jgi:hypothetical protein